MSWYVINDMRAFQAFMVWLIANNGLERDDMEIVPVYDREECERLKRIASTAAGNSTQREEKNEQQF